MPSLQQAVIDRLRANPVIRATLYGGVYPVTPRNDRAHEPDAFESTGAVKPCATVLVDGLVRLDVGQATRPVRVRVRATKALRETVEAGIWQVREVLHRAQLATDHEGAGVPLEWVALVGPEQDPDLPNAYMGEVEFVAAAGPDD